MRVVGARTKKLIVAFHFQFANQAAWRCEECRGSGLERVRRCGFVESGTEAPRELKLTPQRPVWGKGEAIAFECPRSLITPESLRFIEEFSVWKVGGVRDFMRLPARTAEAFIVLEQELRAEHGRQQHDHD